MKERVTTMYGTEPVIIVAPHGADDIHTAEIAENIAMRLNCYAVINRGFERSDVVDVTNDKADCNRIDHCKQDVVYEEFLRPILKIKDIIFRGHANQVVRKYGYMKRLVQLDPIHIFHIHGCGNIVHVEAGEKIALIVGCGLGIKKDSLTCDWWRKNAFIQEYRRLNPRVPGEVYNGSGGGRYAGRNANNLNQYFRKHFLCEPVQSMQLEIPYSLRADIKKTPIDFDLYRAIKFYLTAELNPLDTGSERNAKYI